MRFSEVSAFESVACLSVFSFNFSDHTVTIWLVLDAKMTTMMMVKYI